MSALTSFFEAVKYRAAVRTDRFSTIVETIF